MKPHKPVKKSKFRVTIILFSIFSCIISLLICGVTIFATYMSSTSDQVEKDLNFVLTQTTENLNDKVNLMQDILLSIQKNNTLLTYLEAVDSQDTQSLNYSTVLTQFKSCVNIYSSKNTESFESPFLEQVYLFPHSADLNNSETFCKSMYTAHLLEKEAQIDDEFFTLLQKFQSSGKDIMFYRINNNIRLVATLYNQQFKNIGTLIFDINMGAITQNMENISSYQESFWFVFDKYNNNLIRSDMLINSDEQRQLMGEYRDDVFEFTVSDNTYLISEKHMGLGFNCVIGIPKNYITTMLYASFTMYIYMILILAPLISLLTFVIIYRLTKPLKTVEEKIILVGQGKFDTKLPDFNSIEFSNISRVFNSMTDRINYLINDVYEKKIVIQESELKFLQAQMNPHFMFNVLNTIAIKAKLDGNDDVYKMIHSFSQLTQARIYKKDKDKIKVSEELEYINFYLYLQGSRYENKLTYDISIEDESLKNLYIPKLSIQPIVENGIVHGLEPKHGNGFLQINIYNKGNDLCIDVIDNGEGFDQDVDGCSPLEISTVDKSSHNNVGLNNVHKIIQHFYGEQYGIKITSHKFIGTTVSITMPFDTDAV